MSESSQKSSPPPVARREPRRQRGQLRVEALLAAAAQVFADKGYDAATTAEIAQAAQSSIGSLYQFFPTKEALARAVIAGQAADLRGRLEGMAAASPAWSRTELAAQMLGALVAFRGSHPSFARLLDSPGAPEALILEVRREVRERVAAVLAPHLPGLDAARLTAVATVVQQLMKSAVAIHDDAAAGSPASVRAALDELRRALEAYLDGLPGAGPVR